MNWRPFETRVPGKWVLAGEHAVLRGHMAVALPHPELGLALAFEPTLDSLAIHPTEAAPVLTEMLASVPGLESHLPAGRLRITSTLPIRAGLGSSAALCIAVTQWLSEPLGISRSDWPSFATRLENRFHGKSSGMDVAAILAGGPVRFRQGQSPEPILAKQLPRFTFHDTGLRASTSQCIAQVEAFAQAKPAEARQVDAWMGEAAEQAARGLVHFGVSESGLGLARLVEAMSLSSRCFEAWGLLPPEASVLRQNLIAQGALGAKLTGAGGGGYVVALWGDHS